MLLPSRRTNTQAVDVDDSAAVPIAGFLHTDIKLPTYKPKRANTRSAKAISNDDEGYVPLTINDILSTIRQESELARRVVFETARLQRSIFVVGPVKLSENARAVDIKLIELGDSLKEGSKLILDMRHCIGIIENAVELSRKQDLTIKGSSFQQALGIAKKSLLELEKDFDDDVLSVLKSGMERKSRVDYEMQITKLENIKTELSSIYGKVVGTYQEAMKALDVSQAQDDPSQAAPS